jgi:hypothetical protein
MKIALRIASSVGFALLCGVLVDTAALSLVPVCAFYEAALGQCPGLHAASGDFAFGLGAVAAFLGFWFVWTGRMRRMFRGPPIPDGLDNWARRWRERIGYGRRDRDQPVPPSPPSLAEHDTEPA